MRLIYPGKCDEQIYYDVGLRNNDISYVNNLFSDKGQPTIQYITIQYNTLTSCVFEREIAVELHNIRSSHRQFDRNTTVDDDRECVVSVWYDMVRFRDMHTYMHANIPSSTCECNAQSC